MSFVAGSLRPTMLTYEKPIEIKRRPWQRRIEVFSPKLKRRLTFFSSAGHDAWLLLEADPAVKTFCERPAYVEGGAGRLIDFWVSRGRHAKFWVLWPSDLEKPAFPKSVHGVLLQVLRRADLMALHQRIHNWSQIVPYRVSFARYGNADCRRTFSVAWRGLIGWSGSRRRFSRWTRRQFVRLYSSSWPPGRLLPLSWIPDPWVR